MNFVLNDALWGLAGGLLIGLSAALLLLANGRIAGISGIVGALVSLKPGPLPAENIAFIAGLVAMPALYSMLAGAPDIGVTGNVGALIAGGLMVGLGTRLGGGCTSGHGVCGMSRLSPRSIAATLTFMAVAALVVTAVRTYLGL